MIHGLQPRFTAADFRVPASHLRLLVGDAAAEALLIKADISVRPEPDDGMLASAAFLRLCLDYMRQADDEAFGTGSAKARRGSFGMILAAASQADHFAGALERFVEAAQLIRPDLAVALRHGRASLRLSIGYRGPRCARRELAAEIFALTAQCGLRWLTGRRLQPMEVCISTPLAPYERSVLRHVMGCPVIRRPGDVAICYAPADAEAPLRPVKYQQWAAHELGEFIRLLEEAAADMGRPSPNRPAGVVSAVRELLTTEAIGEQAVARRLGMSPATLRRRLAEAGASFRSLSEAVRRNAALALLATGRSIDDVAADLGFSDARSLRRACHRWFGASPGAYRRSRTKEDAPAMGGRVQVVQASDADGARLGGKAS